MLTYEAVQVVVAVEEVDSLAIVPWEALGLWQVHVRDVFVCQCYDACVCTRVLPLLVREGVLVAFYGKG